MTTMAMRMFRLQVSRNVGRSLLARQALPIRQLHVGYRAALFSSSSGLHKAGNVDKELSSKVSSELKMEKEMREGFEVPDSVEDFLKNGTFAVKDITGQSEVELTREFGNEKIKVLFSVADIDEFPDRFDTDALEDDEETAIGEDGQNAAADRELDEDSLDGPEGHGSPLRCSITIEKPKSGALTFDTIAEDGVFIIDNVHYYSSSEVANALTAESDWQRRGMYMGPNFSQLDEVT
jgi:complement component 1 Q subcomponent-binding protein